MPDKQHNHHITILEWLCCGGLSQQELEAVPGGLIREGQAMFESLVLQAMEAGLSVVTCLPSILRNQVAPRIKNAFVTSAEAGSSNCSIEKPHVVLLDLDEAALAVSPNAKQSLSAQRIPQAWLAACSLSQDALVVAPEIEGILQAAVQHFENSLRPLLNISGVALDVCSDKWQFAKVLSANSLPHPPTRLLELSSVASEQRQNYRRGRLIIKDRFGAGCEDLRVLTSDAMRLWAERQDWSVRSAENLIHQDFIEDCLAFSCSAILSSAGDATWLPLCRQELETTSRADEIIPRAAKNELDPIRDSYKHIKAERDLYSSRRRGRISMETIHYRGGQVCELSWQIRSPISLLNQLLNCLRIEQAKRATGNGLRGWLGVDLLWHNASQSWIVIEANPRMTTSFVGLSQAYEGNLLADFLDIASNSRDSTSRNAAQRRLQDLLRWNLGHSWAVEK